MKYLCLLLGLSLLILNTGNANASTADAREVARLYNCTPKKIQVHSQSLGPDSQTIYRIDCTMPKTEGTGAQATALLVACNGTLCDLLRPLSGSEK